MLKRAVSWLVIEKLCQKVWFGIAMVGDRTWILSRIADSANSGKPSGSDKDHGETMRGTQRTVIPTREIPE